MALNLIQQQQQQSAPGEPACSLCVFELKRETIKKKRGAVEKIDFSCSGLLMLRLGHDSVLGLLQQFLSDRTSDNRCFVSSFKTNNVPSGNSAHFLCDVPFINSKKKSSMRGREGEKETLLVNNGFSLKYT